MRKIIFIVGIFVIYFCIASMVEADIVVSNQAKVCRDIICENSEIINFNISENDSFFIDKEKGLSGKVWGGGLGWITFNPSDGGVSFADDTTGLLKGTALSETSGVINFSVTGQKVIVDPTTGEWNGWAWASGPYGGWIKFDCNDPSSCVRTTWRNESEVENSMTLVKKESEKGPSSISIFFKRIKEIFITIINNFFNSFENLFDGTKYLTLNTRDIMSYSF
ncbi:MAG: hypothetical protein UR25_C0002G0004 [Candidatus Nomurabacteria bacterium GW2011_GWE1_32_28]|uniref:Uncharacterized protein n=1 Tax=Candidatus Nomurabacteria bacterium GW2011_GWF1_31_48 TaxID=1618767 RepID=A0A0F9YGB2_9BACT|nr:MAG: hypothetical protein UR10_C0002G0004 [Candidatus Nomurabacteria bacterium GW2011_GWF2_30_133]KKP29107.1 MAG: hypothetical protein UR18_C0001G0228 [Candidatus Nomurabacteria bacterium GW2011_GWE2_31_40]KKP30483.1 MAG: hypothetical protein UR19_C0002G0004 [Candidatus Nomurabacteria bacterium GW2011_GWF1_31_48]KKP34968.1 MAG: hypothetical protein UR25_C0002G0004 [Candidatus Nomurabacteria bacterium GW2011_GWE1_32_28]HAS80664.1 hypothetical protein [Candidatus Nomurabacteria bacterium]